MVARIAELGPAHATVHYFERDGYYAKNDPEHRRASFWHGRAAEAARLRGHVRPKRFEEVLAGHVPHTGIRLGRKRDGAHQHRPGYDITLSAPKSVSVEGLVFGEKGVVRAHDEAVRETLDWVESELLQTRGYDPVTGRRPRVAADGMVAAGFRHLTSRTQDPQLHTHCVVANMTRNEEGDWRSLEATKIRRNEKLIGAYYRNALAVRLQALGYAVEPTMVGGFRASRLRVTGVICWTRFPGGGGRSSTGWRRRASRTPRSLRRRRRCGRGAARRTSGLPG